MIVRRPPRAFVAAIASLVAAALGFVLERQLRVWSWKVPGLEERAGWVPNYRHIWYAHDPSLIHAGHWGDEPCGFGIRLQTFGSNWSGWCMLDDDQDGLTNGEELGDPCCQWSADASAFHFSLNQHLEYRRWSLSHPHSPETAEYVQRSRLRNPIRCGEYDEDEYARLFKSFYFERASDPHEEVDLLIVKVLSVLVLFALVGEWFWRQQLAQDICPWFFRKKMLSPRVSCAVFLAAYLYMDLISGIVHLILDYAPKWLPLIGPLAKGFQFHHHDPTAIIRISWYAYVSHIHVLCPLVAMVLVLGRASRVQRLFWFWGSVNCHVFQTAHRWAHFPHEALPEWVRALQRSGVLLTHEHHMAHHQDLQQQFTILSGWTDVILDPVSKVVPPWRYDLWMVLGVAVFVFPVIADVCFRDFFDQFDPFLAAGKVAALKELSE